MLRPTAPLSLVLVLLIFPVAGLCQMKADKSYTVLDTIEVLRHHQIIRVQLGNDTIKIQRLLRPTSYDLEAMREVKKDSLFQPTALEEQNFISFMERAAQNCFSHALELAFQSGQSSICSLFNADTHLGSESFEKVVESKFSPSLEIYISKKNNFKVEIPTHSLIVFRDKRLKAIHACYYQDGLFYSKNGAHAMKSYKRIKDVYKSYPKTSQVVIYKLIGME